MSKRRISKQQSARIKKIQQNYQDKQDTSQNTLADGLVITRFGRHVAIENHEKKRIVCSIRPNLGTLVAGDKVIWQAEGHNQGVVVSIYPRSGVLARSSNTGLKKLVAANITQMIIVVAPKPEISWPLLDSYLIIAEMLHLKAVILLNKIDLPSNEINDQLVMDYQVLNYPILTVSKKMPLTFQPLKKALDHQVSVFVGQSGVGKSSLIAEILPHEENIAVNTLSVSSELGQHTTSNSRYYHLPSGGALIDSPGVREFSLGDIDITTIAQGYHEFKPYIPLCKFRNCTHLDTPNCAVIEALNQGHISRKRYDNFIKLCAQFDKTKYHLR